ncbi:hypothetical protein MES5069_270090 [Mesorhizobium escarrei]|uniref:Uncharacterized protein n=1 Tax=Mesorhizobium escarrei TaxID=666018 RepID=A0ABM9DVX6_9HYPH|nr:hypothetical protein MES5069_270090 [Mesorhizobium escarrei]
MLRRVDGRSIGRFIAEEIARPIGADFHIGPPEQDDNRVAEMIEGPKASDWIDLVRASPFPTPATILYPEHERPTTAPGAPPRCRAAMASRRHMHWHVSTA